MHFQNMHCIGFVHGTKVLCTWSMHAGTALSDTRCLQTSVRLTLQIKHLYSHACEAYDCATGTERCDILVPIAALMLHAYPQLVHLCEIDQQEVNSVYDVTASAFILRPHIWQKASGDLHRAFDMYFLVLLS